MPFDFTQIHWLPVLVVTLAGFMLGGVWYGPLFGKAWMAALGKREEDVRPTPLPFVISFVSASGTAIGIALLVAALNLVTLAAGLALGALVGVLFIAAAMASDSAFCGTGLPLFLIQSGYRIVYSLLMGGVLAIWR
jgi:hypothetical protein